jgi:hypothetical protein
LEYDKIKFNQKREIVLNEFNELIKFKLSDIEWKKKSNIFLENIKSINLSLYNYLKKIYFNENSTFPPTTWSRSYHNISNNVVYDANSAKIESFHKEINKNFQQKKVSIKKYIEFIKNMEFKCRNEKIQNESSSSKKKQNNYSFIEEYENNNEEESNENINEDIEEISKDDIDIGTFFKENNEKNNFNLFDNEEIYNNLFENENNDKNKDKIYFDNDLFNFERDNFFQSEKIFNFEKETLNEKNINFENENSNKNNNFNFEKESLNEINLNENINLENNNFNFEKEKLNEINFIEKNINSENNIEKKSLFENYNHFIENDIYCLFKIYGNNKEKIINIIIKKIKEIDICLSIIDGEIILEKNFKSIDFFNFSCLEKIIMFIDNKNDFIFFLNKVFDEYMEFIDKEIFNFFKNNVEIILDDLIEDKESKKRKNKDCDKIKENNIKKKKIDNSDKKIKINEDKKNELSNKLNYDILKNKDLNDINSLNNFEEEIKNLKKFITIKIDTPINEIKILAKKFLKINHPDFFSNDDEKKDQNSICINFNKYYENFSNKIIIIDLIKNKYCINYFFKDFILRKIERGINYMNNIKKINIVFEMDEMDLIKTVIINASVKSENNSDLIYNVRSIVYNTKLENKLTNINKCSCMDGKFFLILKAQKFNNKCKHIICVLFFCLKIKN